jgi:CARDB
MECRRRTHWLDKRLDKFESKEPLSSPPGQEIGERWRWQSELTIDKLTIDTWTRVGLRGMRARPRFVTKPSPMPRSPRRLLIVFAVLLAAISVVAAASAGAQSCDGDCDGDRVVSVSELVLATNVALGRQRPSVCARVDASGDGRISVDELIAAVNRSLSGCLPPQSAGGVEKATRVAVTTGDVLPRLQVISFGLLGGVDGGLAALQSRTGASGAAALEPAVGSGAGQGPITVSCLRAGVQRIDCQRSTNTRTIEYVGCQEEVGGPVRDGKLRRSVVVPGEPGFDFCAATAIPANASVTVELDAYREATPAQSILPSTLVATFAPGATCASAALTLRGGMLRIDGTLHMACSPELDPDCDPSLADLRVTANGLFVRRAFTGPSCDPSSEAVGQLAVDNETTGERFLQTFLQTQGKGFEVAEGSAAGSRTQKQNGRMLVDCLGQVGFKTDGVLQFGGNSGACAAAGTLEIALGAPAAAFASGAGEESAGFRAAADGESLGGGAAFSEQGGVREFAFRAANGQAYQVLQNPAGDAELGTEDARITTLVGSTDGTDECNGVSVNQATAQAVVSAAAGAAFPLASISSLGPVQATAPPCFNPNGSGGDGLVCVGNGCTADCRCPPGSGCREVTFATGTPLTNPSNPLRARAVDSLPSLAEPCSGFAGRSAYGFGGGGPTLESAICAAVPTDGFDLPRGGTVVLAYDAPFAAPFFTASAGLAVDRDGVNLRNCGANRVLTGFSNRNELGPARVHFAGGAVAFDVNADDAVDRVVPDCRTLSLAQCSFGVPTPTPTLAIPPSCPGGTLIATAQEGETEGGLDAVGGATCGDGGTGSADQTYRFTPETAGCYRMRTDASFDTLLYVRDGGSNCSGPELACNDNAGASTLGSEVLVDLAAGAPVVIVVDGSNGEHGTFTLRVERIAASCPLPSPTPTPTPGGNVPDLVVDSVAAESPALIGGQISVVAVVRNQGSGDAGSSQVAFVYALDPALSEGFVVGLLATAPAVGAGEAATVRRSVPVPAALSPGEYFVGAIADSGNSVIEADETNNRRSAEAPIMVIGGEGTATFTPTGTATPTPPVATETSTATGTATRSPSATPSATPTADASPTDTITPAASPTATATPSATATPTVTPTQTNTGTVTPTLPPGTTPTSTPTASSTSTASATFTPTPTTTSTPTLTPSATPTRTNSATPTRTNTATFTPVPSATPTGTSTATSTPTRTNTATSTPAPSASATLSPSPTSTSTRTSTRTSTFTPTPSPTPVSACSSVTTISSDGGVFTGSTSGTSTIALTGNCGSSTFSNGATGPEKVFVWVPSATTTWEIKTCAGTTNFDTVLYLQSSACNAGILSATSLPACNDDTSGCQGSSANTGSRVTPSITAGQTYYIVVDGYSNDPSGVGNFTLSVLPGQQLTHESATLGPTGVLSGYTVNTTSFLGSRFHLDQTFNVQSVGGHFAFFSGSSVFARIVSLSGSNALPSGSPFNGTTVATTSFSSSAPFNSSRDFLTPLSATLPAGDYAVIFGTNSGDLRVTNNNTSDGAGQASIIDWTGSVWRTGTQGGVSNVRFVVRGAPAS